MSSLFLSADELEELTGFKSARGQARWLDQHRWRYALNRNREPRVAREYFQERVGARSAGLAGLAAAAATLEQPDFSALDRR